MENLATEILLRIFAFACTDGGYTACSLSLVSKNTQRVSRSLRFHSVSLTSSPTKLSKLLSLLAEERSATLPYSPRIRHLYLACTHRGELRDTALQSRRTHGSIETVLQQYMDNVSRLLLLVSPDVEMLTLILTTSRHAASPCRVTSPHCRS
ncbi:hypothetical protein C8Q80DRAFT_737633 [Daedaleopsis nitida]|nr:hypothetical protein C8Q80DRAFT_737633 [Daedaleopsis nitida]